MNAYNKREDFLAAALLEAVVDVDLSNVQILIQKYRASGTRLVISRGIAAIHYAAGMDECDFGYQVIELILHETDADVNVQTEEGEIALHIASVWGRTEIVKLLLKHGASLEIRDNENNNAVNYAIQGNHFDVVDILKKHVYDLKLARKLQVTPKQMIQKSDLSEELHNAKMLTPNCVRSKPNESSSKPINLRSTPNNVVSTPSKNNNNNNNNNNLKLTPIQHRTPTRALLTPNARLHIDTAVTPNNEKSTPKRLAYNFDSTSPYYINITHRGNRMQRLHEVGKSATVNLFQLSKENLQEFTGEQENADRSDLIRKWQQKVYPIAQSIHENTQLSLLPEDIDDFDEIVDTFGETDTRFQSSVDVDTASDEEPECEAELINESNFIRSPRPENDYVYRTTELYLHQDQLSGVSIYEKKVAGQPQNEKTDNSSVSSCSTEVTIPLEYDTDDLRAELTQFGEPPGPILKTTKQLYMKKLIKLKRAKVPAVAGCSVIKFSYELTATLLPNKWEAKLTEYAGHISKLTDCFRLQKTQRQLLREGHLKTSFVYLLIDPRVAENLVCETRNPSLAVWHTFLRSIFYVGKGKNSRPFAHLHDAIKVYNRNNCPLEKGQPSSNQCRDQQPPINNIETEPISTKIKMILNIWAAGKGVICLQVFRNIIPSEAFTREAAIIDAIGLSNLTNVKRGDYYGRVKDWQMKDRKKLGVALLHNALFVMLADGESQLRPDDLF